MIGESRASPVGGFFMELKFTIRVATPKDYVIIQSLNRRLFIEEFEKKHDIYLDLKWPDSREGKKYYHMTLNDKDYIVLIAENDQNVEIGYLIGSSKPKYSYRTCKSGELENIYIEPKYRSLGIGAAMVNRYLLWLKGKGKVRAYVSAYFVNKDAVTFYKSLGFEPIDLGLEISV